MSPPLPANQVIPGILPLVPISAKQKRELKNSLVKMLRRFYLMLFSL